MTDVIEKNINRKINVLVKGPVLSRTGYGNHARQIVEALSLIPWVHLGIENTAWGNCPYISHKDYRYPTYFMLTERGRQMNVVDVFIQVTIPNEFEPVGIYNIGVTAGLETDRIPYSWVEGCNKMDVIIVPSKHAQDSINRTAYDVERDGKRTVAKVNVATKIVPEFVHKEFFSLVFKEEHGEDEIQRLAELIRADGNAVVDEFLGSIKTSFNFLSVGMWGEYGEEEDRKNFYSVIKGFLEAFAKEEDVGLVLKINCGVDTVWDFMETKKRVSSIKDQVVAESGGKISRSDLPPIYILHGWISDYDMHKLYFSEKIRAMVGLGREGFGLPYLEAALAGIPVIALDWSGHKDFLKNSFIKIPYEMKPVSKSLVGKYGGIEASSLWAVPDKEAFKNALKKIVKKPFIPQEKAVELAHDKEILNLNIETMSKTLEDMISPIAMIKSENHYGIVSKTLAVYYEAIDAIKEKGKETVLVNMPRSAGDLLILSYFLKKIKEKYSCKLVLATSKEYQNILKGCPYIDLVIEYFQDFDNQNCTRGIFDRVFSPHFATQLVISHPLSKGRNIVEEYAAYFGIGCDDFPNGCWLPPVEAKHVNTKIPDFNKEKYIVLSAYSKPAREYKYWEEVVHNIRREGFDVVQIGDGPVVKGAVNCTRYPYVDTVDLVRGAAFYVGIDTFHMWIANAFDIPHVAIFGSSSPVYTGTYKGSSVDRKNAGKFLETEIACEMKPCYKDQCVNGKQCMNGIPPEIIFLSLMGNNTETKYEHKYPTISGYTTVFNCNDAGIPYVPCIRSMVDWCDEVIVVDGGSTDGTYEKVTELAKEFDKIQVYQREWDWEEPGMDGAQKSFARALCTKEIAVNMDADEIFHEKDYEGIKKIARDLYYSNIKILTLPVIELWGDLSHVTGRRHAWKWRLTKNDPDIVHGIPAPDRVFDEKTGKTYSSGNSDGCFYISMKTGDMFPFSNFYSQDMDQIRTASPEAYAGLINEALKKLPSVWHTSWLDFETKIKQFKSFWHRMWCTLYQKDIEEEPNRFDKTKPWSYDFSKEEVDAISKKLFEAGGEEGDSVKYTIEVTRPAPSLLKEWYEERKKTNA